MRPKQRNDASCQVRPPFLVFFFFLFRVATTDRLHPYLVTTRNDNAAIEPVASRCRFNAIGNEVSARQAIAHSGGAHANAVAHADRAKLVARQTGLLNGLFDALTETEKMRVARVALIPTETGRRGNVRALLAKSDYWHPQSTGQGRRLLYLHLRFPPP